jgi:hypothetical protein
MTKAEKILADEIITSKVITSEMVSHTIIVDKLNVLYRQYVNTILFIIGILVVLGGVATVVILRTPKIKKIESISTDVEQIKSGINDLFIIAKINKINDSIRDINYQHIPKFLPIPTGNLTRISSVFGKRDSTFHVGTDYAVKTGTPIYASAVGVVVKTTYNSGYGNIIEIDSGNKIITRYGHLSKILVKVGQIVYQGEEIALSGNTGNSTGPHLHFEILVNDKNVDPAIFMQL